MGAAPSLVRESEIQKAYWQWLNLLQVKVGADFVPLAEFCFHPPNGIYVPGNPKLSAMIIANLKAQGFKNGVSDMVIAYPAGPYHGAFIELKRATKSTITDEQKAWLLRMQRVGYYVALARGLDEAMVETQDYLAGRLAKNLPWIKQK